MAHMHTPVSTSTTECRPSIIESATGPPTKHCHESAVRLFLYALQQSLVKPIESFWSEVGTEESLFAGELGLPPVLQWFLEWLWYIYSACGRELCGNTARSLFSWLDNPRKLCHRVPRAPAVPHLCVSVLFQAALLQ